MIRSLCEAHSGIHPEHHGDNGALAESELPTDPESAFDIEPPLLIQNGDSEPLPAQVTVPASDGAIDLEKLEAKLRRAKRSAAAGERLCKMGVLAKVEAEQRVLKVLQLQSELKSGRLARAKAEVVFQKSRFQSGEASRGEVEMGEAALARAEAAAKTAAADRERAEFEAARLNLHRQQKLFALGSARKSAVHRAEEKLAALTPISNDEIGKPGVATFNLEKK